MRISDWSSDVCSSDLPAPRSDDHTRSQDRRSRSFRLRPTADRANRAPDDQDGGRSMIAALIRWSVHNRFLVVIGVLALVGAGLWAVRSTPIDALPDLSDTQVIIRTSYPGQAPQIVENQVTYPLTTTMLSVPGAHTLPGSSFFSYPFPIL